MDTAAQQSEPAPLATTQTAELVEALERRELGAGPGDRLAPTAALPSPANAAALQGTKAPDPLRAALKAQMQKVLDRELSPRSLLELEQLAGLAQRILIVSGDPRALANKRGRQGIIGGSYGQMAMGGLGPAYDAIGPDDLDGVGAPMMPASYQENFGAESIRHLVAEGQKPKLNELLAALKSAQEIDGGEDYVKRLKKQIEERLGAAGEAKPNPVLAAAEQAVGVAS